MTEKRFTSDYNGDETLLTHFLEDGKPLTKQELMDLLNTLYEENERLRYDYNEKCNEYMGLEEQIDNLLKEKEQLKQQLQQQEMEYATEHHHLAEENEKLKKIIADDFKLCTDEEFNEVEQINKIYKKEGFKGVIDYSKDKLQYYGLVKEIEKGLWMMVTGGWSDNEFFIDCLNNLLSNFGRKHYRAYERGGAFYYTEKPRADVEITLKKDLK